MRKLIQILKLTNEKSEGLLTTILLIIVFISTHLVLVINEISIIEPKDNMVVFYMVGFLLNILLSIIVSMISFAVFHLLNDTRLKIKTYFKESISEVNNISFKTENDNAKVDFVRK